MAAGQMGNPVGAMAPKPDAKSKGKETKTESKSDKFRRLANRRVPRAVKCINAITNLGNASQYEYTTDQTAKIIKAVADAVSEMASAFQGKKQNSQEWSL